MRPKRESMSVPSESFPSLGFPKQGAKTVRGGKQEVGWGCRGFVSRVGREEAPAWQTVRAHQSLHIFSFCDEESSLCSNMLKPREGCYQEEDFQPLRTRSILDFVC
jgi:hypothetical protein